MFESLTRSSFQNGASVATARPWHSRTLVPCIHIPSRQTKGMNMVIIFVVLSADACASTTRVQRGRPWCSVLSARFVAFYTRCQCRKGDTPLQDWFHESCLNLRERPASREPSPDAQPAAPIDDAPVQNSTEVNATDENDDDASTSSGLPPARIPNYDTLVCATCVTRIPTMRAYAGTRGVLMLVREHEAQEWQVLCESSSRSASPVISVSFLPSDGNDGESPNAPFSPGSKRPRPSADGLLCLAPR